ncbi:hyaluronan mediated motility receptor isoform X2 [Gouania willdenowi]|uniref:hyaluronan mediated motility receptor isoform X2 n=1 Tax=Gouania willdenowi TaxID=441366 RepID=UPI001056A889|nr:hyaluronan mediated motility receptor-like isoform X2 [Gouania willdenowi]
MSFSRAPLKRFNEHVGCAPPPGSYEIKPGDPKGAASFDKSDRFKPLKPGGSLLPPPPSPSRSILMSPVRRALSVDGLVDGSSSVKKERNGMTLERKQQKLLENEIRSLVQQRGEQDRLLVSLQEELKKVEGKLLVAVREKTGLTASVTSLERQRSELKKINEFLKNKVSADTTKKRINSLTMELMEAKNNLDVKNKELSVLQVNSEGQVKVISTDLEVSRNTVTALQDRNKHMEELHQVTKTQNEELENENARLLAEILELRQEVKVVQGYLDAANDQIQDLRIKLQEKTDENAAVGSQVEKIRQLEADLEQQNKDLKTVHVMLKEKEEELQSLQKSASDQEEKIKLVKQKVEDSQAIIHQQEAELVRLREVLRRTERELDERVAHLEQRCLISEEQRNKTQEEGLRRVEELKNELMGLKEINREERKRQIRLKEEHAMLTEELTKEKALVDSLSVLVEQEREDSEEQLRQLKDEMEEVLGELAVMEEDEERRREVAVKSLEENKELQRQLSDTRERLESESKNVSVLKDEHFAAVRKHQEERTNILSKMADLVTELESVKEELKGAKGREEELERAIHQKEKELKEVVEQKEEEIRKKQETIEEQEKQTAEAKAREQNARLLLEAQTRLAERDEEIKASEESHAAQINQLQQELQLLTKEKEEALQRLEIQTQQSTGSQESELEKAQELTLQGQVDLMEEKIQALGEQVKVLTQEKVTLQWEREEQHQELQRRITETQEKRNGALEADV